MRFFKRQKATPDSKRSQPISPASDDQFQETESGLSAATAVVRDEPLSDTTLIVRNLNDVAPMREGTEYAGQTGDWLSVAPYRAAVSAHSLPAKEGDRFRATGHAILIEPQRSGPPLPFAFGPIFYDAEGKIIQWWMSIPYPASSNPFEIASASVAPAGAVSVRLAMRGGWDPSGTPTDFVVGFASLRMEKI